MNKPSRIETTNLTDEDIEKRILEIESAYPSGNYPMAAFLKFTSDKHVDSLINDGLLYMNTVKYFIELESKDRDFRGDENESLTASYDPSHIKVNLAGRELKDLVGKVDVRFTEDLETKVYCLTVINHHDILVSKGELHLSEKFNGFGNKAVLIEGKDIEIFIARIKKAIELDKNIIPATQDVDQQRLARRMEYVPTTYSGRMGIFRKY